MSTQLQTTTERVRETILRLAHQNSDILKLSAYDLFAIPEIKEMNPSLAQATVALASARRDFQAELELI